MFGYNLIGTQTGRGFIECDCGSARRTLRSTRMDGADKMADLVTTLMIYVDSQLRLRQGKGGLHQGPRLANLVISEGLGAYIQQV